AGRRRDGLWKHVARTVEDDPLTGLPRRYVEILGLHGHRYDADRRRDAGTEKRVARECAGRQNQIELARDGLPVVARVMRQVGLGKIGELPEWKGDVRRMPGQIDGVQGQ